jgi:hypothetical protein
MTLESAIATIEVPLEDWRLSAMARGMLRAYDTRWSREGWQVLEIEQIYDSPLVNLSTTRSSRNFKIAGKIDKLAKHDGIVVLVDHKTTSEDLSDDGAYWQQLVVDSQPSHYEVLLLANGVKVDRVVWDVVRKPGIRPRKSIGETAEQYEDRVASECSMNPGRYFARRSGKRTREELVEYAQELWSLQKDISVARSFDRWYRNVGSCMVYGSPCRFLGVCSGHDSIDSDNWYRVDDVHDELEITDGRDVLTNSRLKCFQSCRRKHYYEYELGVRRVDEVEREVLRFGSLWGRAMDEWWSFDGVKDQNDNTSC